MNQSLRSGVEELVKIYKNFKEGHEYRSLNPANDYHLEMGRITVFRAVIADLENILNSVPLTHSEFIQRKAYLKYKPSWDNVDKKQKYLCWSQYTEWFFYDKKDPWYSTNFVEYVEDRNGNQVKPN